jgi:biotin carboxylase
MTEARKKRVLLLVPAITYRATDFVSAAQRLGLGVVIGSDGALPLGGQPVVRVDPDDPVASAQRLKSAIGPVDSVVAVDSQMLPLAARLAAELGLAHNPVASVEAAADKSLQRQAWTAHGISQPAFRILPADANDEALTGAARTLGFPCVVKPVSLSGSRGVIRADDGAGVLAATQVIRQILAEIGRLGNEPIVIEEFVPGWELSIDGLLTEGALAVTAIFDKPDAPDGPTFEETMLVTPSRLAAPLLARACRLAEQAATALGLRYGPIHAELRIDTRAGGERLAMLELAARSIGGLCSRSLRFAEGVSLETLILENSLGGQHSPPGMAGAAGVLMLPVERAGVLQRIDGQTDALAVPGITGLSITIPLGQAVRPLPWGDRYLGFLFAAGREIGEVETALRDACRKLQVVICERNP